MIEFDDTHFLCFATIGDNDNVLCYTKSWLFPEGPITYVQPVWEKLPFWEKLPYGSWVKLSDAKNVVKVSLVREDEELPDDLYVGRVPGEVKILKGIIRKVEKKNHGIPEDEL